MDEDQLKRKIEGILTEDYHGTPMYNEKQVNKLLSLCKQYALSVLPKYDLEDDNLARGFNQCIKQAKESINEK